MKIMRANRSFMDALEHAKCNVQSTLPAPLAEIVNAGLIELDGCVVLKALQQRCPNLELASFTDKTGYECFVNHLHIDDYANSGKLEIAFGFLHSIEKLAVNQNIALPLSGIVSLNDCDVTVRFHVTRMGEKWLCDDLERYKNEGVAEICLYSPNVWEKGIKAEQG